MLSSSHDRFHLNSSMLQLSMKLVPHNRLRSAIEVRPFCDKNIIQNSFVTQVMEEGDRQSPIHRHAHGHG